MWASRWHLMRSVTISISQVIPTWYLFQFEISYTFFTSLNINLKPYYSNRTRIEPEQKQRDRKYPVSKAFQSLNVPNFLFKLAESSLILVILMQLSIPFSIDNSYLFHTLFFVSHIFSTNPVPLYFFIIVCSYGGLQVRLPFTE